MRYLGTSAILPIGYCQTRNTQNKRKTVNKYTTEGRKEIHRNLRINTEILHRLMRNPVLDRSIEYADNRISLYAAQYGGNWNLMKSTATINSLWSRAARMRMQIW